MEVVEVGQIQKQAKIDYRKSNEKINEIKQLYDQLNQYLAKPPKDDQVIIRTPFDIFDLVKPMGLLEQEEVWIINLNSRNRAVGIVRLYQGSLNANSVRVCELFRAAIISNSARIIIAHNHPSGDPNPSPEDIALTRAAIQAGKLLDLEVLDHLVIVQDRYVSLKENGLAFI
jgi:DNA repair protein RadC